MILAPPRLWPAVFGRDVILLDLDADRYRRLGPRLADAYRAAIERDPSPDERALLRRAGLLPATGHGPIVQPVKVALPQRDALVASLRGRPSIGGVAALARARLGLASRGLSREIAAAARWSGRASIDDPAACRRAAESFEAARSWFPGGRRCLPDSLALHRMLSRRGLSAMLVIGVRNQPFRAHCWVQSGEWLLNDRLDAVLGLTPILAIG